MLSTPIRSSIVSAIKICATRKSLQNGKSLHAQIIKLGYLPETQLYNHLLNLYSKSSDFISARRLFDEMPHPNLVSFSTLISGYSQSHTPHFALNLIPHLQKEALDSNQFVFSSLIVSCSKLRLLEQGKQIHSQVIVSDFQSDPFVCTTLVDFYSNLGELGSAISVFRLPPVADPVMYNSMVSGFVSFGSYEEAFELFREALKDVNFMPTEFTWGSLIKACLNLNREVGEQTHGLCLKTGFHEDRFIGTSLVSMYGEFNDMGSSEKVFRGIRTADRALYNSMIVGFSNNNLHKTTLSFFDKLRSQGFDPDECTFSSILKACAGLKCVNLGKSIHGVILKSVFLKDLVVNTALVDMYMKSGFVECSCRVFETLTQRNTVLYNSMISGQGKNGSYGDMMELFIDMNRKGIEPNHATFVALMSSCSKYEGDIHVHAIKHGFGFDQTVQNAVLDGLMKGGAVDEAKWYFSKMRERNVISWTTIISGFCQLGMNFDAVELFKCMQLVGTCPNSFTFSSILKACGSLADLGLGSCIHGCSIKHGIVDEEFTATSLLDMYAKCGQLHESLILFEELPKSNIVPWNTMITAYAQHGEGSKVIKLLERMDDYGFKPNEVTLTSLLSTFSHCGLVDEGVHVFELFSSKYGIIPSIEHYTCMVDMFGRAGLLEKAKCLINNMPYESSRLIWNTFLAACKLHGDIEFAEYAKEHLLSMGVHDTSALVLMSNMYAESGKWDDAAEVRRRIQSNGLKEPGISWLQVKT